MKEVLGAILSVIVVIGGTLLFVYGASGDPFNHDDLRDLAMITGASLVFLVWMFWNDR
jgi:hypothetical protein